jgi:hypothetical protein
MPALSGPDTKGLDLDPCFQAILSVRSTTAFRLTIGARTAHPASESRSGSVGSPPCTPLPTDPGARRGAAMLLYETYRNSWRICCWFWFPLFAVAAQAGASGGVVPELIR